MTDIKYPLQGVHVVEMASAVAAPVSARLLSSFGAEVIKIETPPRGDILRPMAAAQAKCTVNEQNPVFDFSNSGKKVIALNLKSEEGMRIFHELLSWADVFVTNVRYHSL